MIEARVQREGDHEARQERGKGRLPLLQHREPHHREYRRRAAMHDRGAEPAHDPRPEAGVGDQMLIPDVLDDGEARPHRKAENRRVDQEADPMGADQHDDDEPLGELLDGGTRIAAVALDIESRDAQQKAVHAVAERRGREPAGGDRDDRSHRHELVAVEIEQRGEETENRRQPDDRVLKDADVHVVRRPVQDLHDLERDHPLGADLLRALVADRIAGRQRHAVPVQDAEMRMSTCPPMLM